jgi:adenylosuccinate lyase
VRSRLQRWLDAEVALRDGYAEFSALMGMVSATLGKIAHEVILLQKTEVWEVEEPCAK